MAITEPTRRIVAVQKGQLRQKIDANRADIQAHQDAVAKIKAINVQLRADLDTLVKDIPEPTPVEEPIVRR